MHETERTSKIEQLAENRSFEERNSLCSKRLCIFWARISRRSNSQLKTTQAPAISRLSKLGRLVSTRCMFIHGVSIDHWRTAADNNKSRLTLYRARFFPTCRVNSIFAITLGTKGNSATSFWNSSSGLKVSIWYNNWVLFFFYLLLKFLFFFKVNFGMQTTQTTRMMWWFEKR